MNTMIEVDVSELTKDYAVVNGELIEFDEPWEETPNHEDFVKWLTTKLATKKALNDNIEAVLTGLQVRLADLKEFVGNIWCRSETL